MDNEYFNELVSDMGPDDIDNNYFREVAKRYGVGLASDLIQIYEEINPGAKEGQRKINVPLKSTFVFRANKRRMDGVAAS